MRAIVLEAFGGADVMQVRVVPEPRLPGGVRFAVAAAGAAAIGMCCTTCKVVLVP